MHMGPSSSAVGGFKTSLFPSRISNSGGNGGSRQSEISPMMFTFAKSATESNEALDGVYKLCCGHVGTIWHQKKSEVVKYTLHSFVHVLSDDGNIYFYSGCSLRGQVLFA